MNGPYCAHLRVVFKTKQVPYDGPEEEAVPESPVVPIRKGQMVTQGWWECDSGCGQRFQPVPLPKKEGMIHPRLEQVYCSVCGNDAHDGPCDETALKAMRGPLGGYLKMLLSTKRVRDPRP